MAAVNSKKHVLTAAAALVLMLTAAFYALAQQAGETKKSAAAPAIGKRHTLAATLETVQWGWLDPKEPPKLTVDSGDIVAVETMMQTKTPEQVGEWLRSNILATVRAWKSHWPSAGLVFVMDGPASMFEFNEGDELVYFGRGRDRSKKVKLSLAMWNGAASGAGAYQVLLDGTREVGGYFVRWLS